MALAKVYDTEDTVMVPMDIGTAREYVNDIRWLSFNRPEYVDSTMTEVADNITDALTAAGIDC